MKPRLENSSYTTSGDTTWCMAKAQFAILFGERFARAMN